MPTVVDPAAKSPNGRYPAADDDCTMLLRKSVYVTENGACSDANRAVAPSVCSTPRLVRPLEAPDDLRVSNPPLPRTPDYIGRCSSPCRPDEGWAN